MSSVFVHFTSLNCDRLSFSDFRKRNLEGYRYIDRNVSGNRHNSSLPRVENDTDIRSSDVLIVFYLPCTGHRI